MKTQEPSNLFKPAQQLYQGSTYHDNTKQTVITITEDKLRNYLLEFCRWSGVRSGWIAPLGIVITIITSLVTLDFVTRFGKSGDFWCALFGFCGLGTTIWLVITIIRAVRYWKKGELDPLIQRIKTGGD
jgi:hypothetical protein